MEEYNFSVTKRNLIKDLENFLETRNLKPKIRNIIKEELNRFKELNEMDSDY